MKYVTFSAPTHPWAGRYPDSWVYSVPPGDISTDNHVVWDNAVSYRFSSKKFPWMHLAILHTSLTLMIMGLRYHGFVPNTGLERYHYTNLLGCWDVNPFAVSWNVEEANIKGHLEWSCPCFWQAIWNSSWNVQSMCWGWTDSVAEQRTSSWHWHFRTFLL